MTKIRFKDTDGYNQELKIPDTLSVAALGGLIGGLGGLIVGSIIGGIADIVSLCNGWD